MADKLINALLEILAIVWGGGWFVIFFLKGYAKIRYPGAEDGVNPFDETQLAKVRKKGWAWAIVSALALLLWALLPTLFPC